MPETYEPSPARMLARGLLRRCPRCGSGELFRRWFSMVDECPRCELRFASEDGYWTGAMMINLAVTEAVFLAVFVGVMVATWPDVPWTPLLIVVIGAGIVVPVVFYPFSKTSWVALDLAFRRLDPTDGRSGPWLAEQGDRSAGEHPQVEAE